jgi:hypothetical protein
MSQKSYEELMQDINKTGELGFAQQKESDNYTIRKAKSHLFFDDDTRIDFLASERFPGDPMGSMKYVNIDGDLYYQNPNGEKVFNGTKYTKEFPNNEAVGFFGDKVVPNLMPASTFVADVGGGMAGAKAGFKQGLRLIANPANPATKNPYVAGAVLLGSTAAGGFGGNYLLGGVARTGREATIDQFYSLPPEEIAAAHNDLLISSAFSLIPFGQGSMGTAKLLNVFNKDPDALKYLVELRGTTDETIQEAKRFGFDLTPAQADQIGSRGADLQYFLSRQPDARKITQFYDSQAMQISEAIRTFADDIGSQSGKVGDVNTRLVDTSKRVLDELTAKRKQRATRLYNILKESPGGIKVNHMDNVVDLIDSKIAGEVLDESGKVVNVIRPADETVKNLEKFKKMFFDKDGVLVEDLMELDARRTTEMKKLAFALQGEGTGDAGTIFGIMDNMTALMDESAPMYRQARRVYDPNKPALQLVEKSAIGRFGKIMTDKQTATAMKNLFDPNVSLKSLRNSRRILQAADPELFKDIKKQFILDQYDKFFRAESLQKGMPGFQKYFSGNKTEAMMKEMLEPEEFANFSRMNELMGMAFKIPTSGSQTQPLTEMASQLAHEGLGGKTKAAQTGLALINLAGRFATGRLGEDVIGRIAKDQQQGYLNILTDQLLEGPDTIKNLDEVYNFFNTNEFMIKQTGLRGGVEGYQGITEPSVQPYTGNEQPAQPEQPGYEDLLNQINSMSPTDGAMNQPAFDMPSSDLAPPQMLSPTILPDEKDREIAMRQMGGLGSLS